MTRVNEHVSILDCRSVCLCTLRCAYVHVGCGYDIVQQVLAEKIQQLQELEDQESAIMTGEHIR